MRAGKVRKAFFSEEKNQETFVTGSAGGSLRAPVSVPNPLEARVLHAPFTTLAGLDPAIHAAVQATAFEAAAKRRRLPFDTSTVNRLSYKSKVFCFFFSKKKCFLTLPALLALACAGNANAQDADTTPAVAPPTDTVLPRTGVDPNDNDVREHLETAFGDSAPAIRGVTPPNLQITGSLGLSEEYTTNVGAVSGGGEGRGGDFITQAQPAITIADNTQRLQLNLDYRPTGELYAENFSFSRIEEQGSGGLTLTAVPGWLYVDTRGSISQQSIFGGVTSANTATLSPNERETVSSFSFSPYAYRTLGGVGSVQAGIGYSYSATDAPGLNAGTVTNPFLQAALAQNAAAYGSSSLGTERAFTNFTTGEDFGRLQDKAGIDANYYTGNGAQGGGRRVLVTDDVGYAITRLITGLGEAGYENLDYPHSNFAYVGAIGSGGVKITPNQGSSFTLEYRYVDGFGSIYAQGSVQATARIRVFGGYSEGISTEDQDLQNSLLDGSNGPTGVAASALQAAPLLQGSSSFASNQNLNRTHRLDITATYLNDFDTISLMVQRETTSQVGTPLFGERTGAAITTVGTFGSITESHALTPDLSVNASFQYGINQSGLVASTSGNTISLSVGLQKQFPRDLSAYLRVNGTYFVGGSAIAAAGTRGETGDQTSVILGAVKRF